MSRVTTTGLNRPSEPVGAHRRRRPHGDAPGRASSLSQACRPSDDLEAEPDGGPAPHLLDSHLSTTSRDRWEPRSEWAEVVTRPGRGR